MDNNANQAPSKVPIACRPCFVQHSLPFCLKYHVVDKAGRRYIPLRIKGCEFCNLRHALPFCINDHVVAKIKGKIIHCLFCDGEFHTMRELAEHMFQTHLSMAKSVVGIEPKAKA